MRIAFDMLMVEQEHGEALFAIRMLLDALAATDQASEYIILTGCPHDYQFLTIRENLYVYPLKLSAWRGRSTQHQLSLLPALQRLQPDILHVPDGVAPVCWPGIVVLSLHSMRALSGSSATYYSLPHYLYWHCLWHESLQRAHAILTPSMRVHTFLTAYCTPSLSHLYKLAAPIHSKEIVEIYHELLSSRASL